MQNAECRVQNCGEQSSGFYPTQSVLTVGLLPPICIALQVLGT